MDVSVPSTARGLLLGLVAPLALAACAGGFAPQGSPGATDTGFMGCQVAAQPGATVREGDPLAAGEPMAGVPATRMTPRDVGELARVRGLKVTWRYEYAITGAGAPVVGAPPVAGSAPAPSMGSAPDPAATGGQLDVKPSQDPVSVPAGVGALGFSECWCEPPPDGRVIGVAYGMASELVVFVESERTLPAPRDQPPRGWGC
jgi:hypothetical protein